MSMVAMPKLATLGLGILETRIMLYVLGSIREGNLIDVSQSVLTRELGSYSSNVSVALRNLVAMNVIERVDGVAGSGFSVYRISPHLAWYGADNAAHAAACSAAPEPCALPAKSDASKAKAVIRKLATTAREHVTTAAELPVRTIVQDEYSQV